MEEALLRRVQLEELKIAKEIKRVCEISGINYFLIGGTLLGAVRHKGFIPWDDDMDIGMLRADYEKFCAIAPKLLRECYILQTWHTDKNFPLSFGKVRKRRTVFLEEKSKSLKENGFFVDIFPYDYAPKSYKTRQKFLRKQKNLSRVLLMKDRFTPWCDKGKINIKKRIGYLPYQIISVFKSSKEIIAAYEDLVESAKKSDTVYEQAGSMATMYFSTSWFENLDMCEFEGEEFPVPSNKEKCLSIMYGDYMKLPPESERENFHQIIRIEFDG